MSCLRILLALCLFAACGSKNNPITTLTDCTTYCTQAKVCTGANASDVDSSATCPLTCARFPTDGKNGDTSGDTVQCRVYHVGAAQNDPATHCPHAGVSGDDVCGAWCDVYCREAMNNCTGANAIYSSMSACSAACPSFATTGKPGDATGNTVQCRIYHLNAAATDPTTYCPHGLANSTPCS